MKGKYIWLFIFACFLLFSCKKEYLVIDGSNEKTFQTSLDDISSNLPELQKDKLQEAMFFIFYLKIKQDNPNANQVELYSFLNGKNADQIISIAEDLAKKNRIKWSRTSMNVFDESVIKNKILSKHSKDKGSLIYDSLKKAVKVQLKYEPINKKSELNTGFYLYPNLVDKNGRIIKFKNFRVDLSFIFINDEQIIYMLSYPMESSDIGNPSMKKGIKIDYDQFYRNYIKDKQLTIEVKTIIGDKYLYGKLMKVPIDSLRSQKSGVSNRSNKKKIKKSKIC